MEHTAESDAGALLARLAADPAAVERVCQTVRRILGRPVNHPLVRRALLAASEEFVTPPEVTA